MQKEHCSWRWKHIDLGDRHVKIRGLQLLELQLLCHSSAKLIVRLFPNLDLSYALSPPGCQRQYFMQYVSFFQELYAHRFHSRWGVNCVLISYIELKTVHF